MVFEQVFGLLDHLLKEWVWWNREVSLQEIKVIGSKYQYLALFNALNAEVSIIMHWETIPLERELVSLSCFIMDHGCHIDNHILNSKITVHFYQLIPLRLFLSLVICVHDRINNGEHWIIHVVHYECTYTAQHQVKVCDRIALLIKVGRLGWELLLESGTDWSQEILIAQVIKEVKVREVLLMNFFADFEPQVHR